MAVQLMANDALGAHARDELGISEAVAARPLQAALGFGGGFHRRRGGCRWPRAWLAPAGTVGMGGRCRVAGLPGWCWVRLSAYTGGASMRPRHRARHLLGRAGDGAHGRRRACVRRGGLTPGPWPALRQAVSSRRSTLLESPTP
ncbi:MAG: hypothetical protein MZU91_12475 [Desulfosudis oleivorans]|nr:hypothetical protein [Desulfosudis oleivorans]